jgi:hypothetical protein
MMVAWLESIVSAGCLSKLGKAYSTGLAVLFRQEYYLESNSFRGLDRVVSGLYFSG